MKTLLLTLLFSYSFILYSQSESAVKRMEALCSPEFHGRGYVNNGVNIAAKFLASEFKKMGAKKLQESYYQLLQLNVNTFPDTVTVKIDNIELKPGIDYLVDAYSGSYKGDLKLIEIDPYKLLKENKKETKKFKSIRSGQALYLDITPFSERDTLSFYNQIAQELSHMAPVIIRTKEKFMWSVGRSESKYPVVRIQDSTLLKSQKVYIHINNKYYNRFKTKNVVAVVPGESSDSCFVFTAHYDHLGRLGEKAYFPGANDNASGTTMLLELAEYYLQNKPKYDVYFICFTAEEAGLVGSKYFVENPLFDLNKIKFLLNLDIMGSGDLGITLVNGTVHKEEYDRMVKINEELKLLKVVKARGKTRNSDHYFFQEQGVKSFFIYTMGKNKAYHDIFDTSESLDLNKFDDLKKLFIEFIERYP